MRSTSVQISIVVAIAVIAVVGLIELRSKMGPVTRVESARAATEVSEVTGVSPADETLAEIEREVPPELQASGVAARAEDRVSRVTKLNKVQAATRETISRLKSIRACERDSSNWSKKECPVQVLRARAEADGYESLLVDQTVSELAFLKAIAAEEARRGLKPSFSVREVAGAYIKHRDDNVREQALGLAALMTSTEPKAAVGIASQAIESTVSGPLAVQALQILREARDGDPKRVDQTLIRALKRGGWEVRDAVAENILPFITSKNRNAFSKLLRETPVRSKMALHLRLNIEEFDRFERL